MADFLGILRQRLHKFRVYNDRIYALQFFDLCELCDVDISNFKWKEYVKEVDVEKDSKTKREKERLLVRIKKQKKALKLK